MFQKVQSEARKYKLSLILANQHITQLTDEVRDAAFSNAGILLTFNVDADDAVMFAKRMPDVSVEDITRQEVGECIVRVHHTVSYVKTQLPIVPEYDPTEDIETRMRDLNGDSVTESSEPLISKVAVPSVYTVPVCDGVR